MSLPIFINNDKDLQLLQTRWASQINPVLSNKLVQGQLLENITLVTGANTINHLLSRQQVGWMLVDQDAAASVYRSQPLNNKTLTLTTDADVVVKLWVF